MIFPKLTVGAVLITAVLMAMPQHHGHFYFDLSPVMSGEWWRLLTGQLIHSDWEHWFWNAAALAVLGSYLEQQSKYLWFQGMLAGMISINLLLLSDWSQITRYCGLSGALNTLLAVALFHYWRETRSAWVIVAALVSMSKLMIELLSGTSLLTQLSWPPFPPAHLAGTLAGVILIISTMHFCPKTNSCV
ncbi:MAG: rhombosortase [Candidatus Thiodiazotropha sp. (ex Ctena orbiculata)]|nr:rhombosortase [Candidatus Thiodiazotropha taylori]